MTKQKKHQKDFMTYAFGGFETFSGRSMRAAHKDRVANHGLSDEHFEAIAENLVATLNDLNVPQELSDKVVTIVGSVQHRNDVLNR